MPQLENALLAGHDVIFLGERGQAKTRMIRSLTGLLDEWMPIVAGSEINDDPYHPVSPHARDLVERARRRHADHWVHRDERFGEKLATPDTSIADLIGEVDPIKVAEGRYLVRRAHPALRPRAADQPRHLRDQRAARPRRAHPGRPAQRARRARRADPRLQDPPAARRHAGRVGQPRGLHQPRSHHHAAEGPLRQPDPHPLPARGRDRDGDHAPGGAPGLDVGGVTVNVPDYIERDRRHVQPPGPREQPRQPALRRVGAPHRSATSRCSAPTRCAAACVPARPTVVPRVVRPRCARRVDRAARSRSSRSRRVATASILENLVKGAVLTVFKERVSPDQVRDVIAAFEEGIVAHTGEDVASSEEAHLVEQIPALRTAGAVAHRRRRVARRGRCCGRVRARGPAPVEAAQQGRVGHRRHLPQPELSPAPNGRIVSEMHPLGARRSRTVNAGR